MIPKKKRILVAAAAGFLLTCGLITATKSSSHQDMIDMLKELNKRSHAFANPFNPEVKMAHCDSLLHAEQKNPNLNVLSTDASLALKLGQEEKSVKLYSELINKVDFMSYEEVLPDVAISYMRLGERS